MPSSSKNAVEAPYKMDRNSSAEKMAKSQGLKKTVGLSKSAKADSRDVRDSRSSKGGSGGSGSGNSTGRTQQERKSMGRPPVSKRHSQSEKNGGNYNDSYNHGVVDLWLQQNAHRAMSPPRRRPPARKPKNKNKGGQNGDTSIITETTLKAGNFLPWELGH